MTSLVGLLPPAGGRQKEFVDTEKSLGRTDPAQISALVGYAGGQVGRLSGAAELKTGGIMLQQSGGTGQLHVVCAQPHHVYHCCKWVE